MVMVVEVIEAVVAVVDNDAIQVNLKPLEVVELSLWKLTLSL